MDCEWMHLKIFWLREIDVKTSLSDRCGGACVKPYIDLK